MLSITTDYASSNESFIEHIIHLTKNNSQPFNKDMWIRCFAYVLNICVQTILEIISELLQKVKHKPSVMFIYVFLFLILFLFL